jgi:hypothetical protein
MAKKKRGSNWLAFVPLVVGILVTPVALSAASVMALSGPDALTMLYPWVLVVKSPVLALPTAFAISISQWLMYLQFPLYGLVMFWLRGRGFLVAFGAAALLHVVGIGAAILLAHMSNPSLRFF